MREREETDLLEEEPSNDVDGQSRDETLLFLSRQELSLASAGRFAGTRAGSCLSRRVVRSQKRERNGGEREEKKPTESVVGVALVDL